LLLFMCVKQIPNAETCSVQTNQDLHSVLLYKRQDCCGGREERLEALLLRIISVKIVLVRCVQRKCLLILGMPFMIWSDKMRLRVISARNEIPNLNPNEKTVHLAFRASNVDFLNLMQRCPRLRMIQVPPSYRKTMSNAIQVFLEMQGIEMLEGDVWGHRKDLDEYFTVDDTTMEEIRALAASGSSIDDVADQIQKKARIGPELIKYIVKTKVTV